MKNKVQIDLKRRQFFFKNEIYKNIFKMLAYNNNSFFKRWKYILKLTKLHKNSSITRVHNFCIITGRSRSVYKNLKFSRIIFRNKGSFNKITGIRKASW